MLTLCAIRIPLIFFLLCCVEIVLKAQMYRYGFTYYICCVCNSTWKIFKITTFSLFANNDVNVYILLNAIFFTHAIQLFTFKLPLSFCFFITVNIKELNNFTLALTHLCCSLNVCLYEITFLNIHVFNKVVLTEITTQRCFDLM